MKSCFCYCRCRRCMGNRSRISGRGSAGICHRRPAAGLNQSFWRLFAAGDRIRKWSTLFPRLEGGCEFHRSADAGRCLQTAPIIVSRLLGSGSRADRSQNMPVVWLHSLR